MNIQDKLDFIVVGAQKSGTTALDKYLRAHSDIEMATEKEIHFFDKEEYFLGKNILSYDKYHDFFTPIKSKVRGECTPIYMYWEPSIKRIYEYNSEIKIIAVLRNPIERAFSHWNMERDRKADPLSFSMAIRQERIRCREALPLQHRVFSYIDRGFYSEQIRRIWRYFPKEQTLFIKHEDLRNAPHKVLNDISIFLGISEFNNIENIEVHSRPYVSKISNEDHRYLSELYTHEIQSIESMLNWDCSEWSRRNVNTIQQWIIDRFKFS